MLKLKNITKHYITGSSTVEALRGVSIEFRKSEFVSILGQSGCGKTTLLNIIGGLDRYTDGDLVINGKSTKTFKDSDWDSYRNHSIGFVFQSYNLIPHQTVLANVELALTLSGVSKSERRRRAIEALQKVGLGDQIHKKPNQMSGGQMQRVAIARALVNDPEILLADEPTGALDTSTSVQIMEILKEISKERLIIMVTHNPELAETYSTRIIKVLDGLVIDDSDPYTSPAQEKVEEDIKTKKESKKDKKKNKKSQKTSMSFFTALSLSFNNLRTKKGRTIMTSFAGSIGIIGIALILALSTGINAFIAQVQEDTLSTYPLTIQKHTQDMSAMLSAMTSVSDTEDYRNSGKIYVDDSLGTMMGAMSSTVENNLEAFKKHIEENYGSIENYVSDIQYTYDYDLQVFNIVTVDKDGKKVQEARKVGMETVFEHMGEAFSGMSELMEMGGGMGGFGMNVFSEMIDNQTILDQQYEVIAGDWPKEYNEVILVVNSNNQISKMTLYMLGMLDPNEIDKDMEALMGGEYKPTEIEPFTYDDIMGIEFKLLTTSNFFEKTAKTYTVGDKTYNVWNDVRENLNYDPNSFVDGKGINVKIAGIVRPKDGAAATSISGAIGYTKQLTNYILSENEKSEVINQQKETPKVNVLTGLAFERTHYTPENIQELVDKIDSATMEMFYAYMTEQILSNPDFAGRINVKDVESFMGVYMLLPVENQAEILETVLALANENEANKEQLAGLFTFVSGMTGGIEVNASNLTRLLPVLDTGTVYFTVNGLSGLTDIAGNDAMTDIYEYINTNVVPKNPQLAYMQITEVNEQNFLMAMMMVSAESKTEVYSMLIDKAVQTNKTGVDTLCQILSSTPEAPISTDELKLMLVNATQAETATLYLALNGVSGLVELAGEEPMQAVYKKMTEDIMKMTVNEEIFVTILSTMTKDDPAFIQLEETLYGMAPDIDATYDSVLETLDDAEKAKPESINFFAKDFESKEAIEEFIKKYNEDVNQKYKDEYFKEHGKQPPTDSPDVLQYSDIVGSLMSSVTIIVNAISYVLIAFVAISLVVSSIMIGIITNISVLERTKEIGILRAIGASKKDVSRVFNAETLIIGLAAGAIGIISTLVLCIPITAIVQYFTGLDNIRAILPWQGAVILVVISMILTLIAGIIPARSAAKKDPVIALRTE